MNSITGEHIEGPSFSRSLLRIDSSDIRVVCQTAIILGSSIVIIGLLMAINIASSFGLNTAVMLCFAGCALLLPGALALRKIGYRASQKMVNQNMNEWKRYLVSSPLLAFVSIILILFNVEIQFALGFPLAITTIFLFWSYVLENNN